MKKQFILFYSSCLLSLGVTALKAELPPVIMDVRHPGSKVYSYNFKNEHFKCNERDVDAFIPLAQNSQKETFPVIIYGHGQALGLDSYRLTMEHLAKKGIVAIFPTYDKGFFDRDWKRMGRDYVNLSDCALKKLKENYQINTSANQIIFSGHSKGAYVASVAAGLSFREALDIKPQSVILFEAAGSDKETNEAIDPGVILTVIYSDKDKIVSRTISDDLYKTIPSAKKQFIYLKSYTELDANHFWTLTQGSVVGGGPESPYHYYSSWKWLVAAALDLRAGSLVTNPYIYGDQASDKGITGLKDDITRNW